MKKEINVTNRKSAFVELKDYCVGSMGKDKEKEGHFLEVTEWSNGEGYDIHINDSEGERQIHVSYGQFDAIKACIKVIDKPHFKK
jgi:hypothetical protein